MTRDILFVTRGCSFSIGSLNRGPVSIWHGWHADGQFSHLLEELLLCILEVFKEWLSRAHNWSSARSGSASPWVDQHQRASWHWVPGHQGLVLLASPHIASWPPLCWIASVWTRRSRALTHRRQVSWTQASWTHAPKTDVDTLNQLGKCCG